MKLLKKIFRKNKSDLKPIIISKKDLIEKKRYYEDKITLIVDEIKQFSFDENIPKATQKLDVEVYLGHTMDGIGGLLKHQDKIYRVVSPDKLDNFVELYKTGILQTLAKHELIVDTKITDLYTENFPMILEHEKLEDVEPAYWSFYHYKASALNTLLINEIIGHFGYKLIDGHSGNTLFKNNKPVWVDIGSFIKTEESTVCLEEIYSYQISYLLTSCFDNNFSSKVMSLESFVLPSTRFIESFEYRCFVKQFKKFHFWKSSRTVNFIIRQLFSKKLNLRPEFIDLIFNYIQNTTWSDYHVWEESDLELELKSQASRFSRIIQLIREYAPTAKSLIDTAGNSGFFAALASKLLDMNKINLIDYDELAIVLSAERLKSLNINSYLKNFCYLQCQRPFSLKKSEIAVALALTHHLILTQKIDINAIFITLKNYSNKYVFVEFCPQGLFGGNWDTTPPIPEWYNETWFEENFKKHFKLLHKEALTFIQDKGGKDVPHRVIFVGEIIEGENR